MLNAGPAGLCTTTQGAQAYVGRSLGADVIGEVDVGEPWQHTHRTIVTPRTRTSLLRVNRLFFEVFIRTASVQGLTRSKGDVQAFGLEWDSTRPPSASDGTPTNRVTCGCRPQPMDHDTEPTDSSGFIANGGANPSLDHRAAVGWNTGDPNLQGAVLALDVGHQPFEFWLAVQAFEMRIPLSFANIACRRKLSQIALTFAPPLAMLPAMCDAFRAVPVLRLALSARRELLLEILALRHQLSVLGRTDGRFRPSDRLLWVCLRWWWPRWSEALVLVEPATVARWRREWFRRCWQRRARRRPGRPRIDSELRSLIRRMATDNCLWGAPRIHGELLKLGFTVSERTVSRYLCDRPTRRSQSLADIPRESRGQPGLCLDRATGIRDEHGRYRRLRAVRAHAALTRPPVHFSLTGHRPIRCRRSNPRLFNCVLHRLSFAPAHSHVSALARTRRRASVVEPALVCTGGDFRTLRLRLAWAAISGRDASSVALDTSGRPHRRQTDTTFTPGREAQAFW